MNIKIVSLLLASAITILLIGCSTAQHSKAYDYKIIQGTVLGRSSSLPPLEKQLKDAAADGWQVVTASGGDSDSAMIILKRLK
jgi:hypothetical protein